MGCLHWTQPRGPNTAPGNPRCHCAKNWVSDWAVTWHFHSGGQWRSQKGALEGLTPSQNCTPGSAFRRRNPPPQWKPSIRPEIFFWLCQCWWLQDCTMYAHEQIVAFNMAACNLGIVVQCQVVFKWAVSFIIDRCRPIIFLGFLFLGFHYFAESR